MQTVDISFDTGQLKTPVPELKKQSPSGENSFLTQLKKATTAAKKSDKEEKVSDNRQKPAVQSSTSGSGDDQSKPEQPAAVEKSARPHAGKKSDKESKESRSGDKNADQNNTAAPVVQSVSSAGPDVPGVEQPDVRKTVQPAASAGTGADTAADTAVCTAVVLPAAGTKQLLVQQPDGLPVHAKNSGKKTGTRQTDPGETDSSQELPASGAEIAALLKDAKTFPEQPAAVDKTTKDSTGRKDEKKPEKNDGITFSVTDLRTHLSELTADTKTGGKHQVSLKTAGTGDSQVTVTLTGQVPPDTGSSAGGNSTAVFQAMAAAQIQHHAGDIVKAGSIILRDNNKGSINLVLNPKSLGNVKISLQLSDKLVTGHIIVHSKAAFEALSQSADSLKQAFLQSGFDASGFDVALAGQNASDAGFSGTDGRQHDGREYRSAQTYADYTVQGAAAGEEQSFIPLYGGGFAVDIVA